MNVYIARQPIFDAKFKVVAYELLYRDSLENVFKGNLSDDVATSLLLTNVYFNFSIEKLTSGTKAFINFDKALISQGIPELIHPSAITIEILESVQADSRLFKKLTQLKLGGYTLALDDYKADYPHKGMLHYVDLVKVDFKSNSLEELESLTPELKKMGKKLLAEKVETKEMFHWAKNQGYELFQGYFFAKPSVESSKKIQVGHALPYLNLMNELNKAEPDFKKLSDQITQDASLTYKLLKLANASLPRQNEINSVQQALTILGINNFKVWLTMAMMGGLVTQETSEIYKYAMIRVKFLSHIAIESHLKEWEDELCLIGSLSVLDCLLDMHMTDVLESLPLAKSIKDTLLGKATQYSDAYGLSLAYEQGDFSKSESLCKTIGYDKKKLPIHYMDALAWAEENMKTK